MGLIVKYLCLFLIIRLLIELSIDQLLSFNDEVIHFLSFLERFIIRSWNYDEKVCA